MTKTARRKIRKLLAHPTAQLVMAVLLFTASAVLIRDGQMAEWEKVVFSAIYDLPNALTPLFWTITQMGSVGVLLALSLIFLLVKRYTIVIQMLVAGLLAELLAHTGKAVLGRPRPVEFIADLVSRDEFIYGAGFPSGHVAVASAAALVLYLHLPKGYKWVSMVWIVGVGLSRIYLGVHAPMDVVGGFAIGWICVALIRHVKMTDIRT